MRKNLLPILCCFVFVIFLLSPSLVISGASEGILLWFYTVLPNLFPFFVITNLLINTGAFQLLSRVFAPACRQLFQISDYGVLAILGGFLCGYPMGAKIVADLYQKSLITKEEGNYLLSFCNNASPMFIVGFFVTQKLRMPQLAIPSIIILFSAPLLCSYIFRRYYLNNHDVHSIWIDLKEQPITSTRFLEHFDSAIWNGMETILKIGGYIIFFSIIVQLAKSLTVSTNLWNYILIPSFEITNGLSLLETTDLLFPQKYILMMSQLSFGGFCAMFQTKCVLNEFDFSMGHYIIEKLVTAIVTSLLSLLYLIIFTKLGF